jgi:hypothetical protein
MSVKHAHQTLIANDPAFDVSATRWNEAHTGTNEHDHSGGVDTGGALTGYSASGHHHDPAYAALLHAAAHEPGGADALTVDAVAGTGSLRTLGTGATQAAAGNHGHASSGDYIGSMSLSGNANNVGSIAIPAGVTRIWGHVYVAAAATLVPRIRLGGAALDSGTNYSGSSSIGSSTTLVTQTSLSGINLCHALLSSGQDALCEFSIVKAGTGYTARLIGNVNYGSVSAATAPLHARLAGVWANTSGAVSLVHLYGFTTLTGTTGANMGAGTELVLFGR